MKPALEFTSAPPRPVERPRKRRLKLKSPKNPRVRYVALAGLLNQPIRPENKSGNAEFELAMRGAKWVSPQFQKEIAGVNGGKDEGQNLMRGPLFPEPKLPTGYQRRRAKPRTDKTKGFKGKSHITEDGGCARVREWKRALEDKEKNAEWSCARARVYRGLTRSQDISLYSSRHTDKVVQTSSEESANLENNDVESEDVSTEVQELGTRTEVEKRCETSALFAIKEPCPPSFHGPWKQQLQQQITPSTNRDCVSGEPSIHISHHNHHSRNNSEMEASSEHLSKHIDSKETNLSDHISGCHTSQHSSNSELEKSLFERLLHNTRDGSEERVVSDHLLRHTSSHSEKKTTSGCHVSQHINSHSDKNTLSGHGSQYISSHSSHISQHKTSHSTSPGQHISGRCSSNSEKTTSFEDRSTTTRTEDVSNRTAASNSVGKVEELSSLVSSMSIDGTETDGIDKSSAQDDTDSTHLSEDTDDTHLSDETSHTHIPDTAGHAYTHPSEDSGRFVSEVQVPPNKSLADQSVAGARSQSNTGTEHGARSWSSTGMKRGAISHSNAGTARSQSNTGTECGERSRSTEVKGPAKLLDSRLGDLDSYVDELFGSQMTELSPYKIPLVGGEKPSPMEIDREKHFNGVLSNGESVCSVHPFKPPSFSTPFGKDFSTRTSARYLTGDRELSSFAAKLDATDSTDSGSSNFDIRHRLYSVEQDGTEYDLSCTRLDSIWSKVVSPIEVRTPRGALPAVSPCATRSILKRRYPWYDRTPGGAKKNLSKSVTFKLPSDSSSSASGSCSSVFAMETPEHLWCSPVGTGGLLQVGGCGVLPCVNEAGIVSRECSGLSTEDCDNNSRHSWLQTACSSSLVKDRLYSSYLGTSIDHSTASVCDSQSEIESMYIMAMETPAEQWQSPPINFINNTFSI